MSPLTLYVAAAMVAVGIGTAVALALGARRRTHTVASTLALIEGPVRPQDVARNDLSLADRIATPLFAATKGLALRLTPSGALQRLTRMLDVAGNPSAWTAEKVLGAKGAALILLALLGLLLGGGLSLTGLLVAAAGGAAGFFLPDLLLYNAGMKRQDELRRGLADALDMLTVCVEAGQGFDSALLQVARSVDGPVAGEFARVLQEIQIGKQRAQAFASFSKRTNVPEVKAFISALVQADRLGLSIGGVLREQAVQMRLARRQAAEAKAQKVPVKILFPMLLCIFPALFIVVIGPGAIRMVATFSGM